MWVSPFRHLRINGYLLLPEAYRSLSRLSSALSAKTSEVLHESVTKQATNKPKTNGATLCIVEKKAPV